MPKILSELSRVMSASGSGSFQVSSPAVVEEDFLGLRFIQFKDILRHPWCNVIDLSIPCADVGGRDDQVSVIRELDGCVARAKRSEISCCGSSEGANVTD